MKKNCYNCDGLQWDDGDSYGIGAGWYCEGRRKYRDQLDEERHIEMIQKESYLAKAKTCCDLKPTGEE